MANVIIKLSLNSYGVMMGLLDEARLECDGVSDATAGKTFSDIQSEIQASAVLDDENIVRIKASCENFGTILDFIFAAAEDSCNESVYTDTLLKARDERTRKAGEEEKAKAEYKIWLDEVVAKYAGNMSLSYKEICDLINKNDLKPDMPELKYQAITKAVKAYRKSIA